MAASQKADALLDALLDDISGPLVDETREHFDVIAAALRRPDVMALIEWHLKGAAAAPRLRTGPPDRQRIIARALVPDPDGKLRRLADGLDRMLAAEILPGA